MKTLKRFSAGFIVIAFAITAVLLSLYFFVKWVITGKKEFDKLFSLSDRAADWLYKYVEDNTEIELPESPLITEYKAKVAKLEKSLHELDEKLKAYQDKDFMEFLTKINEVAIEYHSHLKDDRYNQRIDNCQSDTNP